MSFVRRLGDKYQITAQNVEDATKDQLNPEPEKKFFSWRNFLDNVKELPNPLNPVGGPVSYAKQLLEKKLEEEGKLNEQDASSWIDEVRKGVNAGQARVAYSFADLLFGGIDIALDTQLTKKVD